MCCGKDKKGGKVTYAVKLRGGLTIPKSTEQAAKSFSARNPGSKIVKRSK